MFHGKIWLPGQHVVCIFVVQEDETSKTKLRFVKAISSRSKCETIFLWFWCERSAFKK